MRSNRVESTGARPKIGESLPDCFDPASIHKGAGGMADKGQQVALITGGTSGIGLAVAETLASRGFKVFICSRNPEAVQETAGKLQSNGYNADGVAADVRSPGDVRHL